MTVLFPLAVFEVVGFLLIRTHPKVRAIFKSATRKDRVFANLALLALWPLEAIALYFDMLAS